MDSNTLCAQVEVEPWLGVEPHPDVQMFTVGLASVFVVAACLYFYQSDGLVDPSGCHAIGRDFINLWTAGRLVRDGRTDEIFNVERFHAVQEKVLGRSFPLHLWSYPPHFLFVVAPLGVLGYLGALVLWSGLTVALYAWAAGGPRRWSLVVLAAAPATLVNLACGQTGALAAALFFGGLRLMSTRPIASGVLFGLLTFKPQYGLLLPIVLLVTRRWTVIAAAIATTALLIGLSAAVFGLDLWRAYLTENFAITRGYLEHGTGLFMVMAPSPFMAMRLHDADLRTAYAVQGLVAVVVVAGVWYTWRSAAPLDAKIGLLGIASLLASPYAHNYDMTLLGVGVLTGYASCRRQERLARRTLLGMVWMLPITIMPLHMFGWVIAPWLLLGFYAWLIVRLVKNPRSEGMH